MRQLSTGDKKNTSIYVASGHHTGFNHEQYHSVKLLQKGTRMTTCETIQIGTLSHDKQSTKNKYAKSKHDTH